MRETIEKVIRLLLYCTFFVPLVVMPTSFIFPFIVPKIILFRTIVICMGAGYTMLLFSSWKNYAPRLTPVTGALLAFLLSFTISTFVGIDTYHSFWDNHERMLGLFTIAHYVLYYFVLSAVLKTWSDWKTACKLFLIAGSLVMFVGLIQAANPYFLLNGGSDRVASTLGNSIYVGAYGLFLIFLSVLIFLRESDVLWKWITVVTTFLAFCGILFSGTRGAILGLMAGILTAVVLYIVCLKDHLRTRKMLTGIIAAGVIITGVMYVNRTSEFVLNIPAVSRVLNTSVESVKNSPRAYAWKAAVESWKDKPVFGWGPNNFYYAFNENYNPHTLRFGYGETWFDNAHNIILNTLAVQGMFGVISYLAIFCAGVVMLNRAHKQQRINIHLFVVGTAFLVAHLIQNITVFENPTSYLYFMFWLAMINRMTQVVETVDVKSSKPFKIVKTFHVVVVGGFALIANLIFNFEPASANMQTLATIQAMSSDPIRALPAIQDTLNRNSPHIDDIRNDVGRQLIDIVANNHEKLGKDRSMQLLLVADEALQKNLVLHPRDIRIHLLIAQLDQTALQITNQPQFLIAAEEYTQKALLESPRRQQVIYSLANIKLQLGKNDEAIALLRGALSDDSTIAETYWRLMVAEKMANHEDKVKEVYSLAQQNKITFTAEEQQIVNRVLLAPPPTPAADVKKGVK